MFILSHLFFDIMLNYYGFQLNFVFELSILIELFAVKAVTLIFISGRCSAISSAKQGKSGSIYNLVKK